MAARSRATNKQPSTSAKSDPAVSYNEFKEYEGQRYTGMKVGRGHKWHYDKGDWKETKITPDLWEISYAVNKRRAGRAPEGSGVPVGTEYHWYIVAHQNVAKQNANDYTTSLTGLKFKVAHKRAGTGKWSATPRTQRKRIVTFLRRLVADIEKSTGIDEAPAAGRRAADREGQSRRLGVPARRSVRGKPSRTVRRARMSAG